MGWLSKFKGSKSTSTPKKTTQDVRGSNNAESSGRNSSAKEAKVKEAGHDNHAPAKEAEVKEAGHDNRAPHDVEDESIHPNQASKIPPIEKHTDGKSEEIKTTNESRVSNPSFDATPRLEHGEASCTETEGLSGSTEQNAKSVFTFSANDNSLQHAIGDPESVHLAPLSDPVRGSHKASRKEKRHSTGPLLQQNELATLQNELKQTREELESSKRENVSLRTKMEEADKGLQKMGHDHKGLEKESSDGKEALNKYKSEAEIYRSKWKKATSELNKLRSQGKQRHNLTDAELTRSVMQLRYDIRDFSIQYTEYRADWVSKHSNNIDIDNDPISFMPSINSKFNAETLRLVLQSRVWKLLVDMVFSAFCWIPRQQAVLQELQKALKPKALSTEDGRSASAAIEAERKFYTWRATTSALIVDSMTIENEKDIEELVDKLCGRLLHEMDSLPMRLDDDIVNSMKTIIMASVHLDRDICKQVAHIKWDFQRSSGSLHFDPDCMEVGIGEDEPEPGQPIGAVIEPGLRKQGKSTGEDFDQESLLLKCCVTCSI